jgi:hypothetical protein
LDAPAHIVRWNPDLQEWFCAVCGRTSDHRNEQDVRAELEVFDCRIVGTEVQKMTAKKRKNRAKTPRTEIKDA